MSCVSTILPKRMVEVDGTTSVSFSRNIIGANQKKTSARNISDTFITTIFRRRTSLPSARQCAFLDSWLATKAAPRSTTSTQSRTNTKGTVIGSTKLSKIPKSPDSRTEENMGNLCGKLLPTEMPIEVQSASSIHSGRHEAYENQKASQSVSRSQTIFTDRAKEAMYCNHKRSSHAINVEEELRKSRDAVGIKEFGGMRSDITIPTEANPFTQLNNRRQSACSQETTKVPSKFNFVDFSKLPDSPDDARIGDSTSKQHSKNCTCSECSLTTETNLKKRSLFDLAAQGRHLLSPLFKRRRIIQCVEINKVKIPNQRKVDTIELFNSCDNINNETKTASIKSRLNTIQATQELDQWLNPVSRDNTGRQVRRVESVETNAMSIEKCEPSTTNTLSKCHPYFEATAEGSENQTTNRLGRCRDINSKGLQQQVRIKDDDDESGTNSFHISESKEFIMQPASLPEHNESIHENMTAKKGVAIGGECTTFETSTQQSGQRDISQLSSELDCSRIGTRDSCNNDSTSSISSNQNCRHRESPVLVDERNKNVAVEVASVPESLKMGASHEGIDLSNILILDVKSAPTESHIPYSTDATASFSPSEATTIISPDTLSKDSPHSSSKLKSQQNENSGVSHLAEECFQRLVAEQKISPPLSSFYTLDEFEEMWDAVEGNWGCTLDEIEESPYFREGNGKLSAQESTTQVKAQYGRIESKTLQRLLEKEYKIHANDVFVDIGHGIGVANLQAAYTFGCESRGIELVIHRYNASLNFQISMETFRKTHYKLYDRYPEIGKIELRQGRLEDPKNRDFLVSPPSSYNSSGMSVHRGTTKAFVNNFGEVYGQRSAKNRSTVYLDHYVAALFALMVPGSIMITMHPLPLPPPRQQVDENRRRQGLSIGDTNASFYDVEKISLGESRGQVSWAGGSCTKELYIWKYTRLQQESDVPVFLCSNSSCENAVHGIANNATTTIVMSEGVEGLVIEACCLGCSLLQRSLRSNRGQIYYGGK